MKTTAQIKNNQKGFTLIELLVVIGILAILLAITLIAINPARQFGQANDTKRRSHVTQILNAIGAYTAENGGQLHSSIQALAADTETELTEANFPGLCDELVPDYIPAIPVDPSINNGVEIGKDECGTYTSTGYMLIKDEQNRITVKANIKDVADKIEVTR